MGVSGVGRGGRGVGRRLVVAGSVAAIVVGVAGVAVAAPQAKAPAGSIKVSSYSAHASRVQQSFVIATAAKGSRCWLSLAQGKKTGATSAHVKVGAKGGIEFTWLFPNKTKNGAWTAQVNCTGTKKVTKTRISLGGSSKVAKAPSKLTIQAKALSPNVNPTVTEPPGARGGGAYPAYGSIILAGTDWFGGKGVNVYSDGASGAGGTYQCVELFERFINTEGWYHGLAGAGIKGASELYSAVSAASFDKHSNGSGYIPVPGDAVIFGGETYGHVAIVEYVAGGYVGLVEQNASANGRTAITIKGSTLGNDGPYLSVIGVLHAKANTTPPPTTGPGGGGTPGTTTAKPLAPGAKLTASFQDRVGNFNDFVVTSGGINHYEKPSASGSWGGEVVTSGSFTGLSAFEDAAGNFNVFATTSGGINHYEKPSASGSWGGEVVAAT